MIEAQQGSERTFVASTRTAQGLFDRSSTNMLMIWIRNYQKNIICRISPNFEFSYTKLIEFKGHQAVHYAAIQAKSKQLQQMVLLWSQLIIQSYSFGFTSIDIKSKNNQGLHYLLIVRSFIVSRSFLTLLLFYVIKITLLSTGK